MLVRNLGNDNVTITFEHDGETYEESLGPAKVSILPYKMKQWKPVSDVYTSLTGQYEGGNVITYNVNQPVTGVMTFDTTNSHGEYGVDAIVTISNYSNKTLTPTLHYVIGGVEETIAIDPQGSFDLPTPVNINNTMDTVYDAVYATSGDDIIFAVDVAGTVVTGDLTIPITPSLYYEVTLDLAGATVTNNATSEEVHFVSPRFLPADSQVLLDPIADLVYNHSDEFTYNPVAGDHAADGQYAFHNGCSYDNGAALYPFPQPPTENVDLVDHTTYGYYQGFITDFVGENVGCGGVSDQSGEYIQFQWGVIESALKQVEPDRDLVAVYTDNTYTTQVQFSQQTVDYVEGLWSEPLVPTALSGTYLAIETSQSSQPVLLTFPDVVPKKVYEAFEPDGSGTGSVTFKPGFNIDNDNAASQIQNLYDSLGSGETAGEYTVEQTDGSTWQYYVADKQEGSLTLKVDSETDNYNFDLAMTSQMACIYLDDTLANLPNDMFVEATPTGYTQVVVLGTSLSMIDLPSYANNIPTGTSCLLAQADNSEAKYVCEATVNSTVSGTPADGDTITLTFGYEEDGNQYSLTFEGAYQDDGEGNIDFALNNVTANGFDKINNDWT